MKTSILAPIGILSLVGLAAGLTWKYYDIGIANDDGLYYLGAVSLARDLSYRDLSLKSKPPQRRLPPGYPLLLSPLARLLKSPRTAMRWLTLLLASLSALLAWRLARTRLSPLWAASAVALFWLQPSVWFMSTGLFSEWLFIPLTLWALEEESKSPLVPWRATIPAREARWAARGWRSARRPTWRRCWRGSRWSASRPP